MDVSEIQRVLQDRWNLRLEDEMSRYVLRRLQGGEAGPLPVMGGDARTGRPVRAFLPLGDLRAFAAAAAAKNA